MDLKSLVGYLDELLESERIEDYPGALNGLQVENRADIRRVACAVDASQASIEAAIALGAQLLIVHHGLFWAGTQPLTGRHYRRIRALIEADVALYSSHLPLDLHPEYGNNAVLAREIGVEIEAPFGRARGQAIGIRGRLESAREELVARLEKVLAGPVRLIAGGPERIEQVAIVTGAGAGQIPALRDAGIDTLITGEADHHHYFDAMESGINLLLGGHYATETWGVRSIAEHLRTRFGLETFFIDQPTGL